MGRRFVFSFSVFNDAVSESDALTDRSSSHVEYAAMYCLEAKQFRQELPFLGGKYCIMF
jgi:hypothetical protein